MILYLIKNMCLAFDSEIVLIKHNYYDSMFENHQFQSSKPKVQLRFL